MASNIVGTGQYTYEVDKKWGRGAGGVPAFGMITGVACDSQDRVYIWQRFPVSKMFVFDPAGKMLSTWGEDAWVEPHGLWFSPSDELYLADSRSHLVTRWTSDGQLTRTWGTPNEPGAPGMPFNRPTRAVVTPDGEMYVSDGYGQFRVHRFGKDGQRVHSWGEEGKGPSQFALPHDVWVDSRDRVMICDRENGRVQFFDRQGNYQAEWLNLLSPMQIFEREGVIYLAEGGARVSILTLDGEVLARWGSSGDRPDQFTNAPHSIWVDSRGDIYLTEVLVDDKVQKFTRRR